MSGPMAIDPDLKERVWSLLDGEGPLGASEIATRLHVAEPFVRQALQVLVFEHRITAADERGFGKQRFSVVT